MGFKVAVFGRGLVDSGVLAVDRAVNEYDERLYFDRNQDTGQWCIYMKMPHNEDPIPVLGWDELPEAGAALHRLRESDTMRHGDKIYREMLRHNEALEKKYNDATDEAAYQVAEAMEWGFRKQGAHPNPRVFIPKGV
jgi:hypothetical protein